MQFKKIILIASLFASAQLVAANANAKALVTSNHTESNLTFSVNNVCSADLGVTLAMMNRSIPTEAVERACKDNLSACEIKVYAGDACTGDLATTIELDTKQGIFGIIPQPGYHIEARGFTLVVIPYHSGK